MADTQAKLIYGLPDVIYDDGSERRYSDKLVNMAYIWKDSRANMRTVVVEAEENVNELEMNVLFNTFISKIRTPEH